MALAETYQKSFEGNIPPNDADWVRSFIAQIHGNESNPAPDENQDLFNIANSSRIAIGKHMLRDYLKEFFDRNLDPQQTKLAFDFHFDCLLVWLESDDKKMQEEFSSIERIINNKYKKNGYYVSSSIMEDWDGIPCPSHYIPYYH